MNCEKQLTIATDDPKLYLKSDKRWYWSGDLYWGFKCGNYYHINSGVVPNVNFKKLETTPSGGEDICHCNTSDTYLIAFTFKPDSNDSNDYLQYLIDRNEVISRPNNELKDANNDPLILDIETVSSLDADRLIEVWLTKGVSKGVFNPKYTPTRSTKYIKWIGLIFLTLIIMFVMFYIFKDIKLQNLFKQETLKYNIL